MEEKYRDLYQNEITITDKDLIGLQINIADDVEVKRFISTLKRTGANPFTGEIYVMRNEAGKANFLVTQEFLLEKMNRNPEIAGLESGIVMLGQNQVQRIQGSCLYPGWYLIGAWARVTFKEDTKKLPRYTEISAQEQIGTGSFWGRMPCFMLEKVAVCQLLRKVMPGMGIYGEEEFGKVTSSNEGMPKMPSMAVNQSAKTADKPEGEPPMNSGAAVKSVDQSVSAGHAGNPDAIPDISSVVSDNGNSDSAADDNSLESRLLKNMTI